VDRDDNTTGNKKKDETEHLPIKNIYIYEIYHKLPLFFCVFIGLYCKVMYDQNVKIRQKKMETIYEVNSQIAI
jgi:hypothetical protein